MCLSRVRVELTKDHRLQRRRLNSLNGALAHFGHKAAESFSNMSFQVLFNLTFSPCSAPSKKRFASVSLSPLLGVFVVESETVVVWSHCRQLCTYSLLHRYHFSDNSTNTESIASRQRDRQRDSQSLSHRLRMPNLWDLQLFVREEGEGGARRSGRHLN